MTQMHELDPQEAAVAEAGALMYMDDGIRMETIFGEGLFFATLRGSGRIWLQSLPFSRLADRIIASAPKHGGKDRGEGSVLGGIGRIFDGDNRF